ncbi:MAG TPA: nuclear transport factor 2 family protein [Solirubrobacterales bacterium]
MSEASAERNERTIRRLYEALDRHDGEAMAALYAPDADFSDPVFPALRGGQIGDMWRMLTERATDLSVELAEAQADDQAGAAIWIARYTFGPTGRAVTNRVRSDFRFDGDGLIARQRDDFSFWSWSRQALGTIGLLLGGTPLVRGRVRRNAAVDLARFRAERAERAGTGG